MGEISEKTKVSLQIGGALAIALVLVTGGRYWGNWERDGVAVKETLSRHETAIDELRRSVSEIKETNIRTDAKMTAALDAANRADGKGTAILLEMASLREALAAKGINVRASKED